VQRFIKINTGFIMEGNFVDSNCLSYSVLGC